MDKIDRLHRLVDHLAETFSGGNSSISNDDEIGGGANVSREVESMTQSFTDAELDRLGAVSLMEALVTLSEAWGQGYDMASGDDLVNDDNETVQEIVCQYHDRLNLPPATIAGAMR